MSFQSRGWPRLRWENHVAQGTQWVHTEPRVSNSALRCTVGGCKTYGWRNNQRQDQGGPHVQSEVMCTLIVSGGTWTTLTLGTMLSSLRFRRNCEYTWGSRLGAENTGYCSSSKENKEYLNQESGNRNEAEVYISKPLGVKKIVRCWLWCKCW